MAASSVGEVKRWYEREPQRVFLPFAAVAAAVVQTVAYLGYKLFYNSFGVRPEEVGYDYASLLPRTALQLALILSFGLVGLTFLSYVFAVGGAFLYGLIQNYQNSKLVPPADEARRSRMLWLGLGATVILLLVANASGLSDLFVWGFCVLVLALLVIEHRITPSGSQSLLGVILLPRAYRAPRRLLLLVAAAYFPTLDNGTVSFGDAVAVACLLFILDRMVPVVPASTRTAPQGGGVSRWLRRTVFLGSSGVLAGLAIAAFAVAIPMSNLPAHVRSVRAGQPLLYGDLLDPFRLAEPRADAVFVRWVAPQPSAPFNGHRPLSLIYFGEAGGTSIFYSRATAPGRIYRFPSSSIAIEAADPGDVPS